MNKWLYLFAGCIFIILIFISLPIVKADPTGWNLYLFIIFIVALFASFYMFIKKMIPKEDKVTAGFKPALD